MYRSTKNLQLSVHSFFRKKKNPNFNAVSDGNYLPALCSCLLWVCKHTCISNQLTNVRLLEHVCFVLVFVVSFRGQVIGSSSLFFFFWVLYRILYGECCFSDVYHYHFVSLCDCVLFSSSYNSDGYVSLRAPGLIREVTPKELITLEMYFLSWELRIEGTNPEVPGLDHRANSFRVLIVGFWHKN